eukprot:m.788291 g.788291  ORF g.788291 m.788291 type:complete len:902 (-) comp59192_c1_seq12:2409-5114(-)
MHTAFRINNVVEWKTLPFQIEALDAYEDFLLIGTSMGQLLRYRASNEHGKPKMSVPETKKTFAKKSIQQLTAVPRFGIILSNSDGYVCVHRLDTLEPVFRAEKTKGCTLYAMQVQVRRDPLFDANPAGPIRARPLTDLVIKLAVFGPKRSKVMLFEFYPGETDFRELKEVSCLDGVQAAVWHGSSLCLGNKAQYCFVNTDDGSMTDVFKTGKSETASGYHLSMSETVVNVDNISVFIGANGKPTRSYGINWSDRPVAFAYFGQYALAIHSRGVEIRRDRRDLEQVSKKEREGPLVQSFDLPKARFLCYDSVLYVASGTSCYRLDPVPVSDQITELLMQEEFDEAVILTEFLDGDPATCQQRRAEIATAHAFSLFRKKNFNEAMTIFATLPTVNPEQVIALFPGFLSDEMKKRLSAPVGNGDFSPHELETATKALITYLTSQRTLLLKAEKEADPALERDRVSRHHLLETIDTTLLKCYTEVMPTMVGSLLRVQNFCNIVESEKLLKAKNATTELVMLYRNRKMHLQALDTLAKNKEKPGPLFGYGPTVEYLQQLGAEDIELIVEYSKWVFKADKEAAFSILASPDYPNAKTWPQDRVLAHLKIVAPDMVLRYLEHCIEVWGQSSQDFHNKLLHTYFDEIGPAMQDYLRTVGDRFPPPPPGSEPAGLGEKRLKLLRFLQKSSSYAPEQILSRCIAINGLFEERAILLGRIGRHEQALTIYVYKLGNHSMAEEYCTQHYNKDKENSRDVYLHLLKAYLQPSNGETANVDAALKILHQYHSKIDASRAIQLLPTSLKIAELQGFLTAVLGERSRTKRNFQMLRSLHKTERFQVQEELMEYTGERTVIDDDTVCFVCKRTVRLRAFACFPNGIVVDLNCLQDKDLCPCANPTCKLKHGTAALPRR